MSEDKDAPGQNPEERAFTGHPDHPPEEADQPAAGNQELLNQQESGESSESGNQASGEQGWTSLPGYG
jgi:hypothetical protein